MTAKILVVDDQITTREALVEILRLEGYLVSEAANGLRALEIIQNSDIDLMLLDIRMPGMDGIEVLQKVMDLSPDTLIIMLTAHGSMETAIEALRHGAHDYLIKPSTSHNILSSVERGLSRRAEIQHKRLLLEQLDRSIQKLRDAEGVTHKNISGKQRITFPGSIMLDLAKREISRGNVKVNLTPTEGKLFQILFENQGNVMNHREIVFLVQGYETSDWEAPEVLRPLISRLRRKLANFPGMDTWITNVRGTGYVMEIPKED